MHPPISLIYMFWFIRLKLTTSILQVNLCFCVLWDQTDHNRLSPSNLENVFSHDTSSWSWIDFTSMIRSTTQMEHSHIWRDICGPISSEIIATTAFHQQYHSPFSFATTRFEYIEIFWPSPLKHVNYVLAFGSCSIWCSRNVNQYTEISKWFNVFKPMMHQM